MSVVSLEINPLLDEKEIFSNSYRTNGKNLPPLITKGYLDLCFSFSQEQRISPPTRVTSNIANIRDHVLTNYSKKVKAM